MLPNGCETLHGHRPTQEKRFGMKIKFLIEVFFCRRYIKYQADCRFTKVSMNFY